MTASMADTKLCEHCGCPYSRNPQYSQRQWDGQRYCSKQCFGAAFRRDEQERFESFFERGNAGDCWEWRGGRHNKGYGQFGNPTQKAHRISWRLYRGAIPTGLHVLHSCDNPPCVNPSHLFLGTNLDNVKDKIAKGRDRSLRGEEAAAAKLTEAQVLQIRDDPRLQATIAAEYGLAQTTISAIKQRRNWAWL